MCACVFVFLFLCGVPGTRLHQTEAGLSANSSSVSSVSVCSSCERALTSAVAAVLLLLVLLLLKLPKPPSSTLSKNPLLSSEIEFVEALFDHWLFGFCVTSFC